jgi:plasmid stabilization system protein ParE
VKPIRISDPASAEFADAVRWYEQKRTGLGSEFFEAVIQAIELVRTRPEVGTPAGRTRSWLLTRFPYRLIYRVRDDDIYIVAIAHTSRRPGYWKNRL